MYTLKKITSHLFLIHFTTNLSLLEVKPLMQDMQQSPAVTMCLQGKENTAKMMKKLLHNRLHIDKKVSRRQVLTDC